MGSIPIDIASQSMQASHRCNIDNLTQTHYATQLIASVNAPLTHTCSFALYTTPN